VEGWVVILYAAIVTGAEESSVFVEDRRADGNAAFGESFTGFGDGDGEHGVVGGRVRHWADYTRVAWWARWMRFRGGDGAAAAVFAYSSINSKLRS